MDSDQKSDGGTYSVIYEQLTSTEENTGDIDLDKIEKYLKLVREREVLRIDSSQPSLGRIDEDIADLEEDIKNHQEERLGSDI